MARMLLHPALRHARSIAVASLLIGSACKGGNDGAEATPSKEAAANEGDGVAKAGGEGRVEAGAKAKVVDEADADGKTDEAVEGGGDPEAKGAAGPDDPAAAAAVDAGPPALRTHTTTARLRPYVEYRWTAKTRGTVRPWVYSSPGGMIEVPFTLHYTRGGTLGEGGVEPLFSNDARWIVYLDDDRQAVARRTDDSESHVLVEQEKGTEVGILLSGISPDSKWVLLYQQTPFDMEGELPVPEGFVEGFYLASLETFAVEPVTHLEGFAAWTDDAEHVLWLRSEKKGNSLVATALRVPDQQWVLRTESTPYGIGQPHFGGDTMVYVRRSQVVKAPLLGGEELDISAPGNHADMQWPRLSPNGEYVAYQRRGELVVREVADPGGELTALTKCSGLCTFEWYDDLEIFVLADDVLSSYRRGGGGVERQPDVAHFSIGG